MEPTIVQRPWGTYRLYAENELCTVKKVIIAPLSSLSLQFHNNRAQRYIVINDLFIEYSDSPVPIGMTEKEAILDWYSSHKEVKHVRTGDELYFDRRVIHRPHNERAQYSSFFEVAYGHNDEEDIVRLADRYGRA